MLNHSVLPPDDPYAPLRVFADMAKAFADPIAFQERMQKLIEQETSAKAASEQARLDTAAAHKLRDEVAKEIAEKRQQFEFETRLAADEHRKKIATEVAAAEADRKAVETFGAALADSAFSGASDIRCVARRQGQAARVA